MTDTIWMRADEIATAFNTTEEKQYWRASIAGTRLRPEVNFNSRASMVQVTYRIYDEKFTVSFSKSAVAFGDYLASSYRSMSQVLSSLKAAGLPFAEPMDGACLAIEYNPKTKEAVIAVTPHNDMWADAQPMTFKVPAQKSAETEQTPVDGVSTSD